MVAILTYRCDGINASHRRATHGDQRTLPDCEDDHRPCFHRNGFGVSEWSRACQLARTVPEGAHVGKVASADKFTSAAYTCLNASGVE